MTIRHYKEEKIIRKYLNGKKIKKIAREVRVSPETVRRILERNYSETEYTRGERSHKNEQNQNGLFSPAYDGYTAGFVSRAKKPFYPRPSGIHENDPDLISKVKNIISDMKQIKKRIDTFEATYNENSCELDKKHKQRDQEIDTDIKGLKEGMKTSKEQRSDMQAQIDTVARQLKNTEKINESVRTNKRMINDIDQKLDEMKVNIPLDIKTKIEEEFKVYDPRIKDFVRTSINSQIRARMASMVHQPDVPIDSDDESIFDFLPVLAAGVIGVKTVLSIIEQMKNPGNFRRYPVQPLPLLPLHQNIQAMRITNTKKNTPGVNSNLSGKDQKKQSDSNGISR